MKNYLIFILTGLLAITGCKEDELPVQQVSLPDNHVSAIIISDTNEKYFATNKGLASFDGIKWKIYPDNPKVTTKIIRDLGFEITAQGPEIWIGTNEGINVASLPIDAVSGATTYTRTNTKVIFPEGNTLESDTILTITIDDQNKRWFGTNSGLSVFHGNKWPAINYKNIYSQAFFSTNKISSISYINDTVYIGTIGGGVARMVSDDIDAITAASPYEIPWSMLPSNNVLAVFTEGSVQWYGTDEGLARHTGTGAKTNWESFYEEDGLINNRVQCITKGSNNLMWFGTASGLTSFDGDTWKSYTTSDGLAGNNILCMAVDTDGSLWIGTDNGVSHFNGAAWVNYRSE